MALHEPSNNIVGPWHTVALQESSEFINTDGLKNQFHVALLAGVDIFQLDLRFNRAQVVPRNTSDCSGWAHEAVITKAPLPVHSLGWHTVFQPLPKKKKRSIAQSVL